MSSESESEFEDSDPELLESDSTSSGKFKIFLF